MRKKKIFAALLALTLSAATMIPTAVLGAEEAAQTIQEEGGIITNSISGWPQGPEVTAGAAIVVEMSTNTILYAKNTEAALPPAAAVKIMTVLTALENSQLTDQVTMTATGVSGATDGGVHISAQLDEVFTMEQCLYAVMLASANDIALQVAEHVGGSVEGFVEMMNARAKAAGCKNTTFTTPTGLSDGGEVTTAYDMARIIKAAMNNETFRTIASASSYTIPSTNVSGGERVLTNNFTMMSNTSPTYYEGILAGKEGATAIAGNTLVAAAERNNLKLAVVLLQGTAEQSEAEAAALLDYGFNNFQKLSLGQNDFNLRSGGTVVIPASATEADVTIQDKETDNGTRRQYLFNGTKVGTAVMDPVEAQNTALVEKGETNMQSAYDFTAGKTMTPYYIIGGVGGVLFIMLLVLMVKVIRSR